MIVSVVPHYKKYLDNYLFKCENNTRDNILEPYLCLREQFRINGCEINTVDINNIKSSNFIIFFDLDLLQIALMRIYNKSQKSIYVAFEPPLINSLHSNANLKLISKLFGMVLTWNDDAVDNKAVHKFYYPISSQSIEIDHVDFQNKKFITSIISNKQSDGPNELYTERVVAIKYFQDSYVDFGFYGFGWDSSAFPSYKGCIDNKIEVLRKYKFVLCYENEYGLNGLLSEKIFDCFHARAIPIYLGALNINIYIPDDCYIDKRNFETYDALDQFLNNMSELEYQRRILCIEKFLKSDAFQLFSCSSFSKKLFDCANVEKYVGVRKFWINYIKLLALVFFRKLHLVNQIWIRYFGIKCKK